jgi:hypothetical protein
MEFFLNRKCKKEDMTLRQKDTADVKVDNVP